MKTSTIATLFAVAIGATATYVLASKDGYSNQSGGEDWLPAQQIEEQLNKMGYQVDRLKVDDGCYEADVTDPKGVSSEMYVDPTTGMPGCGDKSQKRDD